jgi:YHS domain-containing protein
MRRVTPFLVLLALACQGSPDPPRRSQQVAETTQMRTIENTPAHPAQLEGPPMLTDEAPPPKPKALPWETPTPIVFTPEDEKVRAALPFTPAIAMDPIDGSKISIRASTPMVEYKNKFYYFSDEANKKMFMSNPEHALKGGFMKL